VLLRQRLTMVLLVVVMSMLNSCGTSKLPSVQSSPLAASTVGCPDGNVPCSAHIEVPLILVDGSDPGTYGIPMSCSVTAGSQAMKFTAATSMPWFAASPVSGSLEAGGSITVGVPSISAVNVSGRNIGQVTLSASGYSSNSQMAVELNCNVAGGTCLVAYSCNPKTHPLP